MHITYVMCGPQSCLFKTSCVLKMHGTLFGNLGYYFVSCDILTICGAVISIRINILLFVHMDVWAEEDFVGQNITSINLPLL